MKRKKLSYQRLETLDEIMSALIIFCGASPYTSTFKNTMYYYMFEKSTISRTYLIVSSDETVIGMTSFYNEDNGRQNPNEDFWLGISGLFPSYRGKGFGKCFVLDMEKKCLELGAKRMILHCEEDVVDFYKKLGYQVVSDRDVLLKYSQFENVINDSEILMIKNLS